MDAHPLKFYLQLQLASDAAAVIHIPYLLQSLTQECFTPSSYLQKWINRINSLLHSKDSGSRWAGLCLAYKTGVLSKDVMINNGQTWLSIALSLLSQRLEPLPVHKASIVLCQTVLSNAKDIPEFQRQVSGPNVVKFSAALLAILQTNSDPELQICAMCSLTTLIPIYPSSHRASYNVLSSSSLRLLNGLAPHPSDEILIKEASKLYSILHLTGGKVGAANLWKKAVDDTLVFGEKALSCLRTTFPSDGRVCPPIPQDLIVVVPLNADKLRCTVIVLSDLLGSITHRPVPVPLGALQKFIISILTCTDEETSDIHFDPVTRALEVSALPTIIRLGCELLSSFVKCVKQHIAPYSSRMLTYLTYHLEQKSSLSHRKPIMEAIHDVIVYGLPLNDSLICNRLIKAILPTITVVLDTESSSRKGGKKEEPSQKRKGRKRTHGFDGDEMFKVSKDVIFTSKDTETVLLACDVLHSLLQNPSVTAPVHSVAMRVFISLALLLPQVQPSILSADPTLYPRFVVKVQSMCTDHSIGTSSVMGKALALVAYMTSDSTGLDLLLHPRVPPLKRAKPQVDTLTLVRMDESEEEQAIRLELGLIPQEKDEEEIELTEVVAEIVEPEGVSHSFSIASPPIPKPNSYMSSAEMKTQSPLQPMIVNTEVIAGPKSVESVLSALPMPTHHEREEDEEMPSIDMDSDSD